MAMSVNKGQIKAKIAEEALKLLSSRFIFKGNHSPTLVVNNKILPVPS